MRLLRFTARTNRVTIIAGTALIVLLAIATGHAYQSSYPSTQARRAGAELARHNSATTAMYGDLARPGTATQFFSWEMGTFLTLLAAILGVLLAIAVTRAPEDAGSTEVLRSSGISAYAPLRSALTLITATAALLTAASALAISLGTSGTEGADQAGAWVLASTIGLTFLLLAMITCVVAQVLPSAPSTRSVAFAVLGLSFLLRAVADARDVSWLNALTPLGLRATTAPYAGNHWTPLAGALAVAVALAAVALALTGRRDLGAGLLRSPDRAGRRLPIHGILGLERRLRGSSTLIWAVAVTVGGATFTAMGSSAVTATQNGTLDGGFLGSQLGTGDPAAAYLTYTATVVGIVAGIYAVLTVLALSAEEGSGRLAHVLATGVGRTKPLTAAITAAAVGCLLILGLTAVATALVAPQVLDGDRVAGQAFAQILGQWPALLALSGLAGLAVAAGTRWRYLAWIPLAYSTFVALLGDLLKLPQPLIDLGLFRHVPELGSQTQPWALGVLILLALVCSATSLRWFAGRDLAAG
jgi:ABC-2 type transport system permease protein